jgi:hypothetical protein
MDFCLPPFELLLLSGFEVGLVPVLALDTAFLYEGNSD